MNAKNEFRFWEQLSLSEMTRPQWESLCDGCGRCCLHKLEDEDTEQLVFTAVACFELDLKTAQCRHYETRKQRVPDCLHLSPDMDDKIYDWLPDSCAYRLLWQGKPLPDWHPLVSKTQDTVRLSGASVIGIAVSEMFVNEDDLEDHVIDLAEPDIAP